MRPSEAFYCGPRNDFMWSHTQPLFSNSYLLCCNVTADVIVCMCVPRESTARAFLTNIFTFSLFVGSRVARISQRGEGAFWKFDTTVNELDPIFISLELDWGGFSVKIRWSQKKGLYWNSKGFSGRIQEISKKKKKKRSSPTLGELQNKKPPLFWSK